MSEGLAGCRRKKILRLGEIAVYITKIINNIMKIFNYVFIVSVSECDS